jgi:hypothetical protein
MAPKAPQWPIVLIFLGVLVTIIWVAFLAILTFRLLATLVSSAGHFVRFL